MKKVIIFWGVIFILFLIFLPVTSWAAIYYADDAGSGTTCSEHSPCTLLYAVNTKAGLNDTVYVMPGSYTLASTLSLNDAGVTLTAYDTNYRPVITKTSENVVKITADNVTVSYLVLDNGSRRSGWWNGVVKTSGNGTHIEHNEIKDGFIGIEIRGGYGQEVNNNTIHNFGTTGRDPDSGTGMCIGVYENSATSWSNKTYIHHNNAYDAGGDSVHIMNDAGVNYVEISYNNFHDNEEDGIDVKSGYNLRIHNNDIHDNAGNGYVTHYVAPAGDGCTRYLEFYANKVYNNGWYAMVFKGGDSHNLKIYNNLFYGNNHTPASWGANTVALGSGSNIEFYHNTMYNNKTPSQSNTGLAGGAGDTLIKNNIFLNNGTTGGNIKSGTPGTIVNNYVYPTTPGITGANAIIDANPQILDPVNGVFLLEGNSPLIDAGVDVGITADFSGNPRPADYGYDLGAYEYNGNPANGSPDPPKNMRIVQN